MTSWKLILRSLQFHFRAHLGVVLGAAIGSAALIGALVVGDSMRGSLRDLGLARLGGVTVALPGNDRFFTESLADALNKSFRSAPVLLIPGTAASEDGSSRANRVQVVGVDDRLQRLQARGPKFSNSAPAGTILNSTLAAHLKAKVGDTVSLRVQKPSLLSREAPISPQQDYSVALRLPVTGIVGDDEFGRFSLQASQLPPFNAFVPLALLQERLELTNRANLLLANGTRAELANVRLAEKWDVADAELEIRELPDQRGIELRSSRVFLDAASVEAARKVPAQRGDVLTYFVNELRAGSNSTPYSMVSGVSLPFVPEGMKEDQIVINQWLADDLHAKPGDALTLVYFVVGTTRRLEPKTNTFQIHSVVPLAGIYADRDLLPDFPGIAKAEKTENWDAGFPIQMNHIRPKDEKYWHDFRGTPKAFVTLKAAQSMWSNRFGDLTAIRFSPPLKRETVVRTIKQNLQPASLGLTFQPAREQALKASREGQDFGELFLGFSFFLILAALILMALLFQFGLEQRTAEVGTLLALGLLPRHVRRLLLGESLLLCIIGSVLGIAGGTLYARAMLEGLTTIWRGAVSTSALHYHASPASIAVGFISSVIVCGLTMFLVLRKQAKQPARALLAEGSGLEEPFRKNKKSKGLYIAWPAGLIAVATVLWAVWKGETANPEVFFSAGSLLLVCGLASVAILFAALRSSKTARGMTLNGMGLRNATRRTKRSLATIALLACGSFMIVAVGANRLDANSNASDRSSGTGGFALYGESSLPVLHDLNSADGRDFYGLNEADMQGVSVVPMRVRDGDDASCLNLNKAQTPRLLGVNPELLASKKAFTFAKTDQGLAKDIGWQALRAPQADGAIPAIGDQNSIQWAMHRKVGDTLDYLDGRGNTFKVRLVASVANSILQGSLIIDEASFIRQFPGESGYRMFLIDAPSNTVAQVAAALSRALQDAGLELTPASQRLNAFNAVQNTYLNTFQILGGLGLLIGSAGLGVVVLRNVLERRSELALMQALGFRKGSLNKLVLREHAALLSLGLMIGMLAALLAIFPVLLAPGARIHLAALGWTLIGVFGSGLLWTWLATRIALRGELLPALRNE
ncbi:MAG TPA: FtsX-like permease family protein [Candidatus Saccharimonadales bacterium]|nr:FtsX-like permease family protein [Candidatus Saccharimonadales bacterium]